MVAWSGFLVCFAAHWVLLPWAMCLFSFGGVCVLFGVIWWGVRFVAGVTWDVGVVDMLWVACMVMIYVLT